MSEASKHNRFGIQMAVYLLGLAIGGLYVGMVSPVRTVIQAEFGIGSELSIWMINIYTLFYAALIPVIGKLADNYGRKRIFMLCLLVFAAGAVICAFSKIVLGMPLLLVGRVAQAVGACGMIPVANAEMGTSFPEGKRGLALGLAAAIAGMSNVLGAAVGSALLDVFGSGNWPVLFYISVPFCALTFVGAAAFLPNHTVCDKKKLDIVGSVFFVLMVLALLMGLQNLSSSSGLPQAGIPLAAAIVLLVLFVFVERRAANPVFHLEYLGNKPVRITMIASFFIGCMIISMTLIPELVEVTLGARVGSGGYYTMVVGIFAMFGPPVAGKMMDSIGPKKVLSFGLAVAAAGFLFIAYVAVPAHSSLLLILGLGIMGLGMGFSMGAPCNYMILENTKPDEGTSAIATITLIRQLGSSTAPAIFVGFTAGSAGIAGFQNMLLCVAVFCILALAAALLYKKNPVAS